MARCTCTYVYSPARDAALLNLEMPQCQRSTLLSLTGLMQSHSVTVRFIACTCLRVQHLDSALRHMAVGREELLALGSWADWQHVWSKSHPLLPNCPRWGSPGQRCLRCGGRSCAADFCSMGWPTAMVERGCPLLFACPRLLGLWAAPTCGMKSANVLPSVFPNVMLGCLPAWHHHLSQLKCSQTSFEWTPAELQMINLSGIVAPKC